MSIPPDAPTPRPLTFAFPLLDGRWALRPGTALVLDGLLRGVELPGLGTRTGPGETGGLTAVFYVVDRMRGRRGARTGTVKRWEVEDGRVTRTEEAATDVELVEPSVPRPGPTVLVVDDYPDAADSVVDLLTVSGFCASAARSSGEALAIAITTKPDVVVLEPLMRDGGGWEVAAWLRRKDGSGPALIALTSGRLDRTEYRSAGFDYLVRKGDEPRALVAAVALYAPTDR